MRGSGWGLHLGECSAVMAGLLADESVNLTLTSPPYDNLRAYNGYVFPFEAIAAELWRVTAVGGAVVWVVGDQTTGCNESGSSFRQALYFQSLGFSMETMIYSSGYQGARGSCYLYTQSFEYMFVFFKGSRPLHGSLIRDHENKHAGTKNTSTRRRLNGERLAVRFVTPALSKRTNVWQIASGGSGVSGDLLCHEHPASFPELLAQDHILSWSNPGDIVLDPMVGSGTTGKMAVALGREFIGVDVSIKYLDIARRRIELVE